MRHQISIKQFAKMLIQRTKDNFDNIIIVESGSVKGTGKSTFSLSLDLELCLQAGIEFELTQNVVFDPSNEKIIDLVKNKPDAYPIHVDEASKVAYKRNYNDDAQKNLIIFVNVCRKHHKIIIINNPTFWGLDRDLLELADFRITILERGVAIVRGKTVNPETMDKWMRKKTDDILEKMARNELDVGTMMNALRKTPNYLFEINYPELSPAFYKEYEDISKEAELESFYEKDVFSQKHQYEAMVGIIGILKKRLKNEFSWKDVSKSVNRYLKMRKVSGFVTPDKLTKVINTLDMLEFDETFSMTNPQRAERGKGKRYKKSAPPSTSVVINNNNNKEEEKSEQSPDSSPIPLSSDIVPPAEKEASN